MIATAGWCFERCQLIGVRDAVAALCAASWHEQSQLSHSKPAKFGDVQPKDLEYSRLGGGTLSGGVPKEHTKQHGRQHLKFSPCHGHEAPKERP